MNFVPKGIIPPIITPTFENGEVNYEVLKEIVEHFINEGVHGIFPFGTTGEFYAFDLDVYKKVLETVKQAVDGRVPVYAGANAITTKGVIDIVRICEEVGVDAISVLTPTFISQTQDELYAYFETIANATNLPIILYSNPPKTQIQMSPALVQKLATIENIVAIKDSSGDMTTAAEYIRLTRNIENFSVLMGRDTLIHAGLCYGASGAIASCANIAPKLASSIYDLYEKGKTSESLEAQFKFAPIRIACSMGTFPAVIKAGLELQGFEVGKCIAPIAPLKLSEEEKLKKILTESDLIVK